MRTTVYPNAGDPDETDEFPGCSGSVDDAGALVVVEHVSSGVEATYAAGEWSSFDCTAEDD